MLQRNHLDWRMELVSPHDGRLLFGRIARYGYGFGAVVAVMAAFAGVGFWASLLVFWFGGVVAVFGLSLVLSRRKPAQPSADQPEVGGSSDPSDRRRNGRAGPSMQLARSASVKG